MKKCTCSIAQIMMTKSRNDFIVYNTISSMELNWVTDLGTLQCLGEEIERFFWFSVINEIQMLNCSDSDDQEKYNIESNWVTRLG